MSWEEALIESSLPLPLFKKGKVRDVFSLGEQLLIISTDRISAFDVVLPDGIPSKGEALNRLSVYWFRKTSDLVMNHLIDIIDQRSILVVKANAIMFEFIIRGYLFGSAWDKYVRNEPISGIRLPSGLRKGDKLQEPILTITTKEEKGHDRETTLKTVEKTIGRNLANEITEISHKIYRRAAADAEKKGIIIADTKLEYGLYQGNLILIDELLTPDSSRFWPIEMYKPETDPPSFDKQYVRDYLTSTGWNKEPPAPNLPPEIIKETSKKYIEVYEKLTSRQF